MGPEDLRAMRADVLEAQRRSTKVARVAVAIGQVGPPRRRRTLLWDLPWALPAVKEQYQALRAATEAGGRPQSCVS